MIKKYKFIKNR